jgi:hypothetical protein
VDGLFKEGGKGSAEKIIQTFIKAQTAEKVLDLVKKQSKMAAFRELPNVADPQPRGVTSPTSVDDDWDIHKHLDKVR